jgi:DNA mismatch repair protein MutL
LPHATSKIRAAEDLDSIVTLGFRGEALASIAAVARVQMLSKTADESHGSSYEVNGGQPGELAEAGCPTGATVVIRDLFYQTPARAKFLKKDVTEGNYVGAAMERLALSRPGVAVTFLREGKPIFQTPGDGMPAGAVRAVLGKGFYEQLLGVKNIQGGVEVSGFIGQPAAARPNRNWQYWFLNGRWIKCQTASAALAEAYKHSVMAGKFPGCVLYITLPTGVVDVNVHPAKTEVRFADDRPIFQAVYQAAVGGLSGNARQRPPQPERPATAKPERRDDFWQQRTAPALRESRPATVAAQPAALPASAPQLGDSSAGATPLPAAEPKIIPPPKPQTSAPAPVLPPAPAQNMLPPNEARVIGELFHTYFLAEQGEQLLLIDKHAAHERILFEQLKAAHMAAQRQILLAPLPLPLNREEAAVLLEHRALLEQAGFCVDEFGAGALVLRECPLLLTDTNLCEQMAEIAGYLLERRGDLATQALDWIFHSAACRAAVKAGDFTSPRERERFVARLLQTPEIRTCPHGRPVVISIAKKELEKRFGRC